MKCRGIEIEPGVFSRCDTKGGALKDCPKCQGTSVELTHANYHSRESNTAYWSNSQFKEFLDCPARALAGLQGKYVRKPSAALAFGSLMDRALTAPDHLAEFMRGPESIDADGASFFFDAKGKPRDNANMRAYQAVLSRIKADPFLKDGLELWKKQTIFTGTISGLPWKVMLDFFVDSPGAETIIDLKNMSDLSEDWAMDPLAGKRVKVPWYDAWGYFRSMAVYREVVRQNIGTAPLVALFAFTKQEPPDAVSVSFDTQSAIDRFGREVEFVTSRLPEFDAMKRGELPAPQCDKNDCPWCRGLHDCGRTVSAESMRLYTAD